MLLCTVVNKKRTYILFGLMSSTTKSLTALCSIQLTSSKIPGPYRRNSTERTNPPKFSIITLHSISAAVTEPGAASFRKGIHFRWATWQQGGFLSSERSIKALGVMCQLALVKGSLCFFQAAYCTPSTCVPVKRFRFFYEIGSLLVAFQNPAKAFVSKSGKKKGLHRRNRLFCLLLYYGASCIYGQSVRRSSNTHAPVVVHHISLDLCLSWIDGRIRLI